MEKVYDKLVRDNIPEIIEQDGKESIIGIIDEKKIFRRAKQKID